jgi:uncharacterized protein (DUF1778 family)
MTQSESEGLRMPKRAKSIANKKVLAGKRYPLNMRTTDEVRRALEEAAKQSGRSLAQEVEARLERSFTADQTTAMREAARVQNEQTLTEIIHDLEDRLHAAQDRISELETKQSDMMEQACLNALAKVGLTAKKDSKS